MRKCPGCGKPLERVPSSKHLNSEQWDAVKAGDYFCESCPDNGRGQTGLCYWREREVEASENAEIEAALGHPVINRAELERAWMAYGFMQFCGTVHDTKIGIVNRDLQTLGRGFKIGDVVFYSEHGTTLVVERPVEARDLGKSGFIASLSTTVGIPKHCVSPIDPLSVVEIR